MNGQMSFF